MDGDESASELQVQLQPKSDIAVKKPTAPTFIGDNTTVKCTINYNYNPGLQNDEGYEQPAPHQVPKRIEYFDGRNQLENNSALLKAQTIPVFEWNTATIDSLLTEGDTMYLNACENDDIPHQGFLSLNHLPSVVRLPEDHSKSSDYTTAFYN